MNTCEYRLIDLLNDQDEFVIKSQIQIDGFESSTIQFLRKATIPEELLRSRAMTELPVGEQTAVVAGAGFLLNDVVIHPKYRAVIVQDSYAILNVFGDNRHATYISKLWAGSGLIGLPRFDKDNGLVLNCPENQSPIDLQYSKKAPPVIFSLTVDDSNIFHWLWMTLPRAFLLNELDRQCPLVFGYKPSQMQLDSLRLMGVKNPVVTIDPEFSYRVERAYFACIPEPAFGSVNVVKKLANKIIINSNIENISLKRRKIFLNRNSSKNSRVPLNLSELCKLLEESGYISINLAELDFEDQVRTIALADSIVFEHGAAGALVPFCHPNCRILELLPPAQTFSGLGLPPHLYILASTLNLNYGAVVGQLALSEPVSKDFFYDLDCIRTLL